VAPLSVPEPDASRPDVATSEAVQLFLDRAAAQDRRGAEEFDLGEVGALTRHLDGLPLAIELAAARTRHLAPAEISRRLAERMSVLGPGPSAAVPAHHRTMQAGIEWSYDLLDPGCRHLFDVLSVMPADFDLDTAEAVAAVAGIESSAVLDHLGRLIDASMVAAPAAPGDRRYRVLVLLRQYGAERLEARGEADRARQAHADHFRAFARAAGVGIDGPEAGCWWERVATERAHLRAAVEWSVRHDDPQSTLDFARLLARAAELVVNADFLQVVELFRSLLDGGDGTPPSPRGWAWLGMVGAAYLAGDLDLALGAGDSALTLFTEADDPDGLASAQSNLAFALLLGAGDAERARQLFAAAESAARVSGLHALEAMSSAAGVQCRLISDEPLDSIEPALVRSEALPDAGWATLRAHRAMNRFYFAYRAGDLDGAERAARQARQFSTAAGSSIYDQSGLIGVGVVALARHDIDGARGPLLHAAQIAADVSNAMQLGAALMALAATADAAGDEVAASRLWGAGTSRAPVWPLVADRWFPARAADTLGDRFEAEVKRGRDLAVRQALDLAVG
jgi:tetratricopeptide (TPR) repeat protein